MSPKVSVILYGYNHGRYIREAVDSILSQTFQDFELIATDNGSSDDSAEILRSYAAENKRIKLMLHKDNVLTGARFNMPFALCAGEYISFLNADDYYLPRKLERQTECFAGLGPDYGVVYSPGYTLNDLTGEKWVEPSLRSSGDVLEDMLRKFFSEGNICPMSPLVRKECLLRYPFYPEAFFEGEAIYRRMAMRYKFQYIDEPLVVMRDHLYNLGKAIRPNRAVAMDALERLGNDPEFPPRLRRIFETHRSTLMRNYGWQGIRVLEDGKWAREAFMATLRWSPSQIFHPKTAAGLALSWLPRPVLRGFNGVANRLLRHKQNIMYRDLDL